MRANLFHSYGNEDCFPGRQNELKGSKEKITKTVLRLIEIAEYQREQNERKGQGDQPAEGLSEEARTWGEK